MILSALLHDFNALFPALNVHACPKISDSVAHEQQEMQTLYARLQAAYPHADAVYFSARTWQLWLWQPIYVAVWAAERGYLVDLQGGTHRTQAIFTEQFRLPEHDLVHSADVHQAAWGNIQNWLAEQWVLCPNTWQISEKLAHYWVYDGILKALAAAHRFGLLNRHDTEHATAIWRDTIQHRCFGTLSWLEDDNFQANLRTCCQHYRRDEQAILCEGCPKRRNTQCDCSQKSAWCPFPD